MKPRSANHVLLIALCVLALFVAQTLGSRAGYLCVCGDKPVPTGASQCSSPSGKDCAPNVEKSAGHCKDHVAVASEQPLRLADAGSHLVAPQAVLFVLPLVDELLRGVEIEVAANRSGDFKESPPFGVTVARTVVLRI